MDDREAAAGNPLVRGAITIGILALAMLAIMVFIGSCTGGFSKPGAGDIGVVRNGGPLDNHNIRQIIPNGAGNTWTGLFSGTHFYPVYTQQRFFRMETCGSDPCQGADSVGVTVPTSDGIDVTIEGTVYFQTVFGSPVLDPSNVKCARAVGGGVGNCALKSFDTQFGTRTFGGKHPYEGSAGMEAFLAANVEPVVVNDLRATVGTVTCADLVSSCTLVQNQGQQAINDVKQRASQGTNQTNIARVEKAVETGLNSDLIDTLGGTRYFQNIRFTLQRVILPGSVQSAINDAQSAFADVSQSQARVASARLDAQANTLRESGYRACPMCAQIDAIKALPSGLTALGSNFAVAVR